jgi:hypothetical protein
MSDSIDNESKKPSTPGAAHPDPAEPEKLLRAAAQLRSVLGFIAYVVAALWIVSAIKLVPLIFQNQSIDDRFGMLVKVIVWLAGMLAPAVICLQLRRRVPSASGLATVATAIGFVHTMIGCAAIGMYWGQYTVLERGLIITWASCGAIVFAMGVRAESSKPQEPEPPPKRHVPKPDVD